MMNSMASPCGLLNGFLREQQINLFKSLARGLESCQLVVIILLERIRSIPQGT